MKTILEHNINAFRIPVAALSHSLSRIRSRAETSHALPLPAPLSHHVPGSSIMTSSSPPRTIHSLTADDDVVLAYATWKMELPKFVMTRRHYSRTCPRQRFAVLCVCASLALFCARRHGTGHEGRTSSRRMPFLMEPRMETLRPSLKLPSGSQLSHVYAIAEANAAASSTNKENWLRHLNQYLDPTGTSPLGLEERPGPLLGRLTSLHPLPCVEDGPTVSVIMVACNAQDTILYAAKSILQQTWKPLELVIVDDASEDGTWLAMQSLSQSDARVKLLQNKVQVGPYVSRNRALSVIQGVYVTCQDADDWALPRRLEMQVRNIQESHGAVRANVMYMLRIDDTGRISTMQASPVSPDGASRKAYVSAMYEVELLRQSLGYWDSVSYSGDGEMLDRARGFLGSGFSMIPAVGVLLADRSESLGKTGYRGKQFINGFPSQDEFQGSTRQVYHDSYKAWHRLQKKQTQDLYMPFPLFSRPYSVPPEMDVDIAKVCAALLDRHSLCKRNGNKDG